jgi:lysophospholipase L1-like esterase
MIRRRSLAWVPVMAWVLGLVWIAGCADVNTLPVRIFDPGRDSGSADFTVLVALGSSLTAGVQNAGLAQSGQEHGYAALFARQLGKAVLSGDVGAAVPQEFVLPGVSDPGTDGTLVLTNLVPPEIEPIESPGAPVNTQYPAPYNDLAVPGATALDAANTVMSQFNPAFDLVLRRQGTMLQQAAALSPTFVILWFGENEVLGKVTRNAPIPSAQDFEAAYRTVVETLAGLPSAPGMVTATIGDVSAIPFVTTVPPFVVNPATQEPVLVDGQLVPLIGPDGPLALPGPETPGDRVTLYALDALNQGDGIPQALGGSGAPLADAVVLNVAEQAQVQAAVQTMNGIIATVAGEHGIPVVDAQALLNTFVNGVDVGGVTYDAGFLTGGTFGLDGIHLTNLGYGVLANAFIGAVNAGYGASIPPVDLSEFVSAEIDRP